ncbi:MAG: acetyl-CoA C-acyltransferase [Planctomycetaceae bacterium]|nr:acetyl-CoA C-acyltransferase [Planctomycetaceae bacterium]
MNRPTLGPRTVVVTHALRTPIGKYLGTLADLSAADLGAGLVRELVGRSGVDPAEVGQLIFGNGRQAGGGPNVARQISVRAGLPVEVPALTINMACASGLKSISLAADWIALGRSDVVVAGGVESMSGLPFFLPKFRQGYRMGHAPVVDAMYQDGFHCPIANMLMGATAEKLAGELGISRSEQDEFALQSQHKCEVARKEGRFAAEIVPVDVPRRGGATLRFETDEHARDGATLESLAKLPAVFDTKAGTVSAGNSSGITDGAAALLLMSAEHAAALGLAPLAVVGACAEAGVPADVMGIGPVPAMEKLAALTGRAPSDYDLIELNEAFAAQVLACHRKLPLPMDRLNVNGGSIALGHPIGATGARIAVTLLHELARRGGGHGLATLCVSGGMGLAMEFQSPRS